MTLPLVGSAYNQRNVPVTDNKVTTLIDAVVGKSIAVYSIELSASANVKWSLCSGIDLLFRYDPNMGYINRQPNVALYKTEVGKALTITFGTSDSIEGNVYLQWRLE